jgi:hypothetical protein
MKIAAPFPVVLALVSGIASAQGASEATQQLRGCTESAEGPKCLDKSSRTAPPSLQSALAGDGWIVGETTSPIDYSPIATATTSSRKVAGGGPAMQLSIRCRGGRTELAVTGPAIKGRGGNYSISYRVNDGQSLQLAGAAAAFGDGVAFKGDVVALLQQLPGDGELAVSLLPVSGNELEGIFSLNGLETLRTKIGATCRWPHAIAKPNDR